MRKRVAGAAAALGAVCLILAPMTAARAADTPLPIYQATGISQSVLTTLTLKPSIFDPLMEMGTGYTKTSISSEGGGIAHSLAAQVYPGSLIVGFLGCGGSAIPQIGGTVTGGWIQANYPAGGGCSTSAHHTMVALPDSPLSQIASINGGDLRASAGESSGGASIETARFNVSGGPAAQVLSIGSMTTSTNIVATSKIVQNVVTSTAKDINLLGGILKIGTLTSTSIATSDGTTGIGKGTLTFAGATITANGVEHAISIDNTGIHSEDSRLSRAQNIGLSEQITDLLAQAGITLTAATPTKIIDGANAESSVGGLTISLDAAVPSVPIPQELAPIIGKIVNAIPTQCLSDFHIPAPICFGPGILPGLGSEARITFTIGSTDAFAVGGLTLPFSPGGGCTGTCGGITPPITTPSIAPVINPEGPQPLTSPPAVQGTQQLRLFGLVARLPAVALLWAGLVLLVLALGFAYGPSLRHARAR